METSITPPLRLAWFHAKSTASDLADNTLSLVMALKSTCHIELVDETCAHDFVWKHFRRPYDLAVYELDNTNRHQFMWPYIFHYPGVLWLRTTTLHGSRVSALEQQRRADHYAVEFTFNHGCPPPLSPRRQLGFGRGEWPMLRAPLLASTIVAVSHPAIAASLQVEHPEARFRIVKTGVEAPTRGSSAGLTETIVFGVAGRSRLPVIQRAFERASAAGVKGRLYVAESLDDLVNGADVVLACDWPPSAAPLTTALTGMAAEKPVVVFETEMTAEWAALDPQTWRTRGGEGSRPIVVSVDARDEEHSLLLVMRRLSTDPALRAELGAAGHAWWRSQATLGHAVDSWNRVFTEAVSLPPPPRPADWPSHLTADGTELARAILSELGQSVDFLQS